MHAAVNPPTGGSDVVKRKLVEFLNKQGPTGLDDDQKRARVEAMASVLAGSSHSELTDAAGRPSWMAALGSSGNPGAKPPTDDVAAAATGLPPPLRKLVPDGHAGPLDFARRPATTAQELIDEAAGDTAHEFVSGDGGVLISRPKKKAYQCADLHELSAATEDFVLYARARRWFRHLQTEADFLAHREYTRLLAELGRTYTFDAVLSFDVLFRRALYEGKLSGWTDPAQRLFQKCFEIPGDTVRLQATKLDKPKLDKPKLEKPKPKPKKAPTGAEGPGNYKTDGKGKMICKSYNAGKDPCAGKLKSGKCPYAHVCSKCREPNCMESTCTKH